MTKRAASGPFGTFCHHVVTKCAAVTNCAGSASTLIRFVTLVTKCAVVTKRAATGPMRGSGGCNSVAVKKTPLNCASFYFEKSSITLVNKEFYDSLSLSLSACVHAFVRACVRMRCWMSEWVNACVHIITFFRVLNALATVLCTEWIKVDWQSAVV